MLAIKEVFFTTNASIVQSLTIDAIVGLCRIGNRPLNGVAIPHSEDLSGFAIVSCFSTLCHSLIIKLFFTTNASIIHSLTNRYDLLTLSHQTAGKKATCRFLIPTI